jgi:cytidine deaminase
VAGPLALGPLEPLIEAGRAVRGRAYAPYSGFQVGAALLDQDGRIHLGVNVENSAYPTGQCAERTALGAAVTAGAQRFSAIAIVTPLDSSSQPGSPCGNCRQALSEFGIGLTVVLAGPQPGDPIVTTTLAELLPRSFGRGNL